MRTHQQETRKEARRLRANGASYSDIADKLGLSKSTVRYMVRGVFLTKKQRSILDARRPEPAGACLLSPSKRRATGSKGGKVAWGKEDRSRALKAVEANRRAANLAYRSDEIPVKNALEVLFDRTFRKEQIGRRVVDFACGDLIIEHSSDFTKG